MFCEAADATSKVGAASLRVQGACGRRARRGLSNHVSTLGGDVGSRALAARGLDRSKGDQAKDDQVSGIRVHELIRACGSGEWDASCLGIIRVYISALMSVLISALMSVLIFVLMSVLIFAREGEGGHKRVTERDRETRQRDSAFREAGCARPESVRKDTRRRWE